MCPLKRCAALVANQLRSSVAQRAHGRRAVCLFLPFANTTSRLIQHHSPFLLSTPGGSSWHLADATGDKLYGVLNGHLMAMFCCFNFTCTPPQSLKDPDCTLTIGTTMLLIPVSTVHYLYEKPVRLLPFAHCNGR